MSGPVKKVVLAYSGGLDTSIIVPWLKENHGCEVVAFAADLGQGPDELEGIEEKALRSGAVKCIVRDLREEFVTDFIFPCLQAGAVYERKYLLGTAMARPLIARHQVEVAHAEGADALAHGCTGKGNDQVRFELTYKAFDPKLRVIAPWREWDIRGRDDAIAYANARGIPVKATPEKSYSHDRNLWHLSHEGADLEDPWNKPDPEMFQLTCSPAAAPAEAAVVEIGFEAGCPVSLDGETIGPVAMLERLNELGSTHGIGRCDMVENRLVGMKSRGIYETPGGTILYVAHSELEHLVLDRDTMVAKDTLAPRYAELVYNGRWYSTLREALDRFVRYTQRYVNGTVRLELYRGNVTVTGRSSPNSLYREDFATFGQEDVYDQQDAEGFINLYGLTEKVRALVKSDADERYVAPDYQKFKRD